MKPLAWLVAFGSLPLAAAAEPCSEGAETIFSCSVGAKRLSVCQLGDDRLRYRFGPPGRPELTLEASARLSSRPYPGGGETRLRFSNEGYHYLVFDRMARRDDGAVEDVAGVHVLDGGTHLTTLTCTGSSAPGEGKVQLGRIRSGTEEDFVDLD